MIFNRDSMMFNDNSTEVQLFSMEIPGIFIDVLSVNIIRFFNLSETLLFITQLIFNTVEEFGEILFISLAFAYFFKNTNHILNNRYTRKIINK